MAIVASHDQVHDGFHQFGITVTTIKQLAMVTETDL